MSLNQFVQVMCFDDLSWLCSFSKENIYTHNIHCMWCCVCVCICVPLLHKKFNVKDYPYNAIVCVLTIVCCPFSGFLENTLIQNTIERHTTNTTYIYDRKHLHTQRTWYVHSKIETKITSKEEAIETEHVRMNKWFGLTKVNVTWMFFFCLIWCSFEQMK